MAQVKTAYYLRLTAQNKPGVLAAVTAILGEADISIEAVSQQEPEAGSCQVPLVMLTHPVQDHQIDASLARIIYFPYISIEFLRLRVESLF